MGCCKESINFLKKIGTIEKVNFFDSLKLIGENGEVLRIKSSLLPSPLHLLHSILHTNYLSSSEKANLFGVMLKMAFKIPAKDASALEYLQKLSCSKSLEKLLIEPMLVSALNEELEQASAKYARMVLLRSLLGSRTGYQLGVPQIPLSKLIELPAVKYLSSKNCEVRTKTKVKSINIGQNGIVSLYLADGKEFKYDYYVAAISPLALNALGINHSNLFGKLRWRPIVSAHLIAEGICPDFDHACVLGEPFQWVFNKSADFALNSTYIQAVASGADSIVNLQKNELAGLAKKAVKKACPASADINFRAIICKEKRATFSTSRNIDALRPQANTQISNLFLAGDWIQTQWPSTIESAVRSGMNAAEMIIQKTAN